MRGPWHRDSFADLGDPLDQTKGRAAFANRAPWDDVGDLDPLEQRLIERLVARDERAFNELVRAYDRRVFALVLRMIGNRAEAEDLAQEVFVQVFKAIGSFRGESKLSTCFHSSW